MDNARESTIVDNEVYNLIRATAAKLEGLAAYNKYSEDGGEEIWQSMKEQDEQAVMQLLGKLEECATNGKLSRQGGSDTEESDGDRTMGQTGKKGSEQRGKQSAEQNGNQGSQMGMQESSADLSGQRKSSPNSTRI